MRFVIGVAAGFLAVASPAWSELILHDNFDYPLGSALEDNDGWGLRGPSTGITVDTGNVPSPPGGVAATGNSILLHDGEANGGTGTTVAAVNVGAWDSNLSPALYYSMNLQVTSTAGLATSQNGVFIAGFNNLDATPTAGPPTLFHGRVYIRGELSGYQIGVNSANADATHPATFDPTVYSVNDVLFVVVKLQMKPGTGTEGNGEAIDDAYMWINPDRATFGAVTEPEPLLTSAQWKDQFNTIQSFCLRTVGIGPEYTRIDELRIGTTWADVVPVSMYCPNAELRFDVDNDMDVDMVDFALYQICYTGPGGTFTDEVCRCVNSNGDNAIDAVDLVAFEACASGPAVPADEACDDGLPPP